MSKLTLQSAMTTTYREILRRNSAWSSMATINARTAEWPIRSSRGLQKHFGERALFCLSQFPSQPDASVGGACG